jgi:hypothetical protein
VGEYRVTQLTEWSWRYDTNTVTVNVTAAPTASGNTVTFTQGESDEKWLDGNGYGQFLIP